MKNLTFWKELASLLGIVAFCFLLPIGLYVQEHRPFSASTSLELGNLVIAERQDEIRTDMKSRYEGGSINFSDEPDPRDKPENRWALLVQRIFDSGVGLVHAQAIAKAAQPGLDGKWPVLVEHGYVDGKEAWVFVGSSPHDTGFLAWACMPSAEDIRREDTNKYCTEARAVVIMSDAVTP